jgi:hypothetical protein
MARAGIDRAFYISWSPEDIPSDLTRKKIRAEDVREILNRGYAIEVLRKYPDRFYWFPCHLGPQVRNHMQMAREHLELGAASSYAPSFWGSRRSALMRSALAHYVRS